MSDDRPTITTDPEEAKEALEDSDAWLANLPLLERIRPMLTQEAKEFLRFLSVKKGLQERVSELMNEVYHPYPDPAAVADLYRRIVLQDVWVLHGMEGAERYILYLAFVGLRSVSQPKWPVEHREKIAAALLTYIVNEAKEAALSRSHALELLNQLLETLRGEPVISARLSRTAKRLYGKAPEQIRDALGDVVAWCLGCAYGEWASSEVEEFFATVHDPQLLAFYDKVRTLDDSLQKERNLSDLPDLDDLAKEILRLVASSASETIEKVRAYLQLFRLPPLEHFAQDILTRVTRELKRSDFASDEEAAKELFSLIFPFLEELPVRFYPVVTAILRTLGVTVMEKGSDEVVHEFSWRMASMPFPPPRIQGINEDWQIERHPAHLPMIRTYLEIIRTAPRRASLLLAALHVNLRVHGVFISDTDLFQPDVSALLNSDIRPVFKQVKQLCRLFPVFFQQIGAEGELRKYSTRIDEHVGRADKLIHFFRKQIHIESNNTLIGFAEDILKTWADGRVDRLLDHLPQDVQRFMSTERRYLDSAAEAVQAVMEAYSLSDPLEILRLDHAELERFLVSRGLDPRPAWLVRIHTLLVAKYDLAAQGARDALLSSRTTNHDEIRRLFEQVDRIKARIEEGVTELSQLHELREDILGAIRLAMDEMDRLKETILSPEKTAPEESIYRKRHIAAGIPSMYGTYWERKLDALGSLYRLENVVEMLMDRLVETIDFTYFTRRGLSTVADIIDHLLMALKLDGIESHDIRPYFTMLRALVAKEGYTLHQYLNVLHMLSERVRSVIERYFYGFHQEALSLILERLYETEEERGRVAERVMREILSDGFGLSQLDAFLGRVMATLGDMRVSIGPEKSDKLLGFNPHDAVVSFDELWHRYEIQNGVFLGNKGYNLWLLISSKIRMPEGLKLAVPEAFIVTTEVHRYRDVIRSYGPVYESFRRNIIEHIHMLEAKEQKKLGRVTVASRPTDGRYAYRAMVPPLLVSVRSGSAVSMPGAMTTFLNVGLTEEGVRQLADLPNFGWTAWDCYRRMIQSWGMAHGIPRDAFDRIIARMKKRRGVKLKLELSPANMEQLAYEYLELVQSHGVAIPDDPYEQVVKAVELVLDSWDSELAKAYRRQFDISDAWGTAVIVQTMVLGNLNFDSGTGVAMTRTVGGDVELYGDYVMYSQGEDVVSGLVYPYPISEKERQQRGVAYSLEKDFPAHYRKLKELAKVLIFEHDYPDQEIEFTFEDSDPSHLYILQTRSLVKGYSQRVPVFVDPPEPVAMGVAAGGGAYVGRIVVSREGLSRLKKSGDPLVLVRPDTVPDDVDMIFECGGLLTARGGVTSHAAVTAARIGRVAVVGCRALEVDDDRRVVTVGGVLLREGDWISIDGSTGAIYPGRQERRMTSPSISRII